MNIKNMTHCGLFAALIAVSSWISVPFGVPFTMQTFGIFCALLILGGKPGTISVAAYVLLGAVGLPVFAGFQGGVGVILSPLGGFIVGFIVMGIIYFLITKHFGQQTRVQITALITGLLVCYFMGAGGYSLFSGADLLTAFKVCTLPFIAPDLIKLWLAAVVAKKVNAANRHCSN
ncbi:MAG: biotin transporter BioY [Oscillospiraceae bacterium]|nr:biotin transporter BioY [Oscillospiraceae bacterium]